MKYFILLLLLMSSAHASAWKELDVMAKQLKGSDMEESVWNVNTFVESQIEYEFYWKPRGTFITWDEKKGDCTDMARLKCYLLIKQGYRCRTVHGYAGSTLHDWYEVAYKGGWYSLEQYKYDDLKKIGNGVW